MSKSVKLNPQEIEIIPDIRPRHAVSQTIIDEFAECMRNGDLFPQIVVFAEKDSERYVLADGEKRLLAHLKAKEKDPISVDLRDGSLLDAKLYAIGSNSEHGERRSPLDVRRCIRLALLEPAWKDWSNNRIAKQARVNPKTVSKVREDMVIAGEISNGKGKRKAVRDGKEMTVQVPAQKKGKGKKKAAKKKGNSATPQRTQEEYDRESILEALATLNRPICSGAEAADKYNLEPALKEAKFAHDWLGDLIEEIETRQPPTSDDEAEFLKAP